MTSCISIAANQKSYNSTHTHTHTPQENQNPVGHRCHVADRKQMACWGRKSRKKHAKEGQRECFPPSFSPSIIPSSLVGGQRKTEAVVVFGG